MYNDYLYIGGTYDKVQKPDYANQINNTMSFAKYGQAGAQVITYSEADEKNHQGPLPYLDDFAPYVEALLVAPSWRITAQH